MVYIVAFLRALGDPNALRWVRGVMNPEDDWEPCLDCGRPDEVLGYQFCHECWACRRQGDAFDAADGWCPGCDLVTVILPNLCSDCATGDPQQVDG